MLKEIGYARIGNEIGMKQLWDWCNGRWFKNKCNSMLNTDGYTRIADEIGAEKLWDWCNKEQKNIMINEIGYDRAVVEIGTMSLWVNCAEIHRGAMVDKFGYSRISSKIGMARLWFWCDDSRQSDMLNELDYDYERLAKDISMEHMWDGARRIHKYTGSRRFFLDAMQFPEVYIDHEYTGFIEWFFDQHPNMTL